ncbi:uncharacterized protein LOC126839664 isoform X2 [Adelges cooleyi]|uniref:uncharacterized protein LOC126839664 isoform X2 n=1 Tax=Adelges cooleyi TaxID=133065 RepID=UPI00218072B8|nr:uncharacterized protein LOC126839664 isoform X2 [Adelges cooleyi]
MITKMMFLLACFKVLVMATRTDQHFQGEEYLEELYNAGIVQSLNLMFTSDDKNNVNIDDNDIRLLSEECYTNESCLNDKKTSTKKYRHKMQAIQCVNGLFVLHVLNELEKIMYNKKSSNIKQLKNFLREPIIDHLFYLTHMLSFLNMAKWDAYAWQIKIFTFVAGLTVSDTDIKQYKQHFTTNYNVLMRGTVLNFVGRCIRHEYLSYPDNPSSEKSPFSSLLDNVSSRMNLLYRHGALEPYGFLGHCTVWNLTLMPLYVHQDIIFDWSLFDIGLKTENVKIQLLKYSDLYFAQQMSNTWELDPIGGNKYNALIAKCIHLRIVYAAWFHLFTYHNLLNRPLDGGVVQQFMGKGPLVQIWHTLVFPLKRALRAFRFDENIYWSAISIMMVDINVNSKQQVAVREEYTRNYFCQEVENLGLARASDINRKLTKLEVAKEHGLMYERIKANGEMLDDYTDQILRVLSPVDGSFIRLIVSPEGNETFVTH